MRVKTLAFASAAGVAVLASAASAGPLGGAVGGVGGGVVGNARGDAAGAVGGLASHGGGAVSGAIGGGLSVGVAGMGPPASATTHIGGSANGVLSGGLNSGVDTAARIAGRANGAASASAAGRDANANFTVSSGTLAGLSAGLPVTDAEGDVVGTVEAIERTKDGVVTGVLMLTANGERRLIRLEPAALRVARGVVTTTENLGALHVARGSARASLAVGHSVAAGGQASANASLARLNTGQAVRDARGRLVGVVARVDRTASGEVRRVLVRTTSGERRVLRLAPRSLSFNDGVVTTTAAMAGASAHG